MQWLKIYLQLICYLLCTFSFANFPYHLWNQFAVLSILIIANSICLSKVKSSTIILFTSFLYVRKNSCKMFSLVYVLIFLFNPFICLRILTVNQTTHRHVRVVGGLVFIKIHVCSNEKKFIIRIEREIPPSLMIIFTSSKLSKCLSFSTL